MNRKSPFLHFLLIGFSPILWINTSCKAQQEIHAESIELDRELQDKLYEVLSVIDQGNRTPAIRKSLSLISDDQVSLPHALMVQLFLDLYHYTGLDNHLLSSSKMSSLTLKELLGTKKGSAYYSQLLTELLQVCGNTFVGGNVLVCGTITGTSAQGPPGPVGPQGATGPVGGTCCDNYIYASDTTTQSLSVANTYQNIILNTNGALDGWDHVLSSASFTCNQTGTYLIRYDARFSVPTTIQRITFRVIKDGVEIAGSAMSYDLVNSASIISDLSKSFLANIIEGEVLIFQWQGTASGLTIVAATSGTIVPSFAVSISRVK